MKDRGFTLIEVLVSVALVSALIAGAAGLLAAASGAVRSARLGTTAALLAMQKVEQLRANPAAASGALSGTFEEPVEDFTRRWTITPGVDTTAVRVEVFAPRAGRVAQVHAVIGGGA